MNTNRIKRNTFPKTEQGSIKKMKNRKTFNLGKSANQFFVRFICVLVIVASFGFCKPKNGSSLDFSDIFDIGFFSFGKGSGSDPNLQPYNSVDNSVAQLPVDFGATSPQAVLFINSLDNVDRYKELEIRFSHPMNKTITQANFSIVGTSGPLLGPNPGGEFYWMSSQKLRFKSYREFRPAENYTLAITSAALTISGTALQDYSVQFRTAVDYSLTNKITQGSQYTLNGNNDITFDQSAALQLASTFQNPVVANNYIQGITLNKVGSTNSQTICNSPPCSMSSPITLTLDTSQIPPTVGGNTYYYEIKATNGKTFRKYFSFNYGRLENPDNLLPYVADGIMDEAQMLPFLGKAIQKFTTGAFKVLDSTGVPRTFQDFLLGLPNYPKRQFYENGQWTIGEACMKPDGL